MRVEIRLIDGGQMPEMKRDGDACFDCKARIDGGDKTVLNAGSRALFNLGFAIAIPDGYEGVIRPRSGLSAAGIDVALGTVDSNYRGEVKATLINNSINPFLIDDGDRICQLAIRKTECIEFVQVEKLGETMRNDAGFGSTGVK